MLAPALLNNLSKLDITMATGSTGADDHHIHVLGIAADGSHQAQTFRMHRDKQLEALGRA